MHSYRTTRVESPSGSIMVIDQCLKTRKGDDTSEALQLKQMENMVSKRNFRNLKFMKHSDKERKLRKKISKNGAKESFKNELLAHIR